MIKRFFKSNSCKSSLAILFILIAAIWTSSNVMWGKHAHTIVKADGKGYYAHLPAIFIYQDLNFGFFDDIEMRYSSDALYYDFRKYSEGQTYNKYFGGTAFFIAPFFLIGHTITHLTGGPTDGYSHWYMLSVSWAAIFYLILTLLVMRRILSRFGISDSVSTWALLAIYFGTNWFYYVLSEPAMSHVYSVFLIALFFLLVCKWADAKSSRHLGYAMVVLGFILWVRPVNGIVLFSMPLAFGSLRKFANRLKSELSTSRFWLFALAVPAILCLQLIIYKVQTGDFLIYSYEEEGFNFMDPHMIDILFSYKKGLFLYTPLTLLAVLGNIRWWRSDGYKALYSTFFFVLITYVLSSWWNWYYGGSFSSRAYIEYYTFLLLPLAFLLRKGLKKWQSVALKVVVVALVLLCQFQTYQYRYMVIHWDNMTKEKYWDVFLDFSFLG